MTPDHLFDLFGKFGPIRQIRQGIAANTKGTAFVVYEDVMDAKIACDKLNGFNFQGRYLVVLYHQVEKMVRAEGAGMGGRNGGGAGVNAGEASAGGAPMARLEKRREELEKVKRAHGVE